MCLILCWDLAKSRLWIWSRVYIGANLGIISDFKMLLSTPLWFQNEFEDCLAGILLFIRFIFTGNSDGCINNWSYWIYWQAAGSKITSRYFRLQCGCATMLTCISIGGLMVKVYHVDFELWPLWFSCYICAEILLVLVRVFFVKHYLRSYVFCLFDAALLFFLRGTTFSPFSGVKDNGLDFE